jgi:transcription antitermination factor NusG
MPISNENWFAIQVHPNKEKLVANYLAQKQYRHFLPLWRSPAVTTAGKPLETALFPGYLFCRFDLESRAGLVVTTPGVVRIVGCGRTPEPVPDSDIENLMLVTHRQGWKAESSLHSGDKVRILHGAFAGVEGILSDRRGPRRVVVQVALLGGGVSMEVEEYAIVPADLVNPSALALVRGLVSEYCAPAW